MARRVDLGKIIPEKGVDYYTEAEKNQIEDEITNRLVGLYKRYESTYTTISVNEDIIPIGIEQYDENCILEVYIEGRILNQDEYEINENTTIILTNALSEIGTVVQFVVYKFVQVDSQHYDVLKGDKGDSGAIVFDTIAEMKADEDLVAGDTCQTLGYNSKNDGNAELYNIVNDNTLVEDNYNIIDLNNGLKAVRMREKSDTKYVNTLNTDLNDYLEEGWYFFDPPYTPINIPVGVNGFLEVRNSGVFVKQFWYRAGTPGSNDFQTFVRTKSGNNAWGAWKRYTVEEDLNVYGVAPYGKNTVANHYFVDNVNGDDANEGTQANPFKTIDPILAKINNGALKIDIFLKRGQTHLLKGTTFNACTIHLNVFGDGNDNATITTNHGTSAQSLVFYNCHGNFTNITFTNIGFDMYFDGGSLSATNCIFNCKFTTWGAGCRFENCTIKTLKTRMANTWTYGDNNIIGCVDSYASTHVWYKAKLTPSYAINHDDSNACYVIIGGSLLIYGSTSIVTNETPAYNRLLIFNGLTFCLSAGPATTTTGTHFSQQSEMSCCKVISNSARLSTLSTSANGINYTNGTEYPQ